MFYRENYENYVNAFVADMLEHPGDDTCRLVMADYLSQHGNDKLASLIRTQIALATLPEDAPERLELEKRERQLLTQHGDEWAENLQKFIVEGSVVKFHRGFPDLVISAENFLNPEWMQELRDTSPVTSLCIVAKDEDEAGKVAISPQLTSLDSLTIAIGTPPSDALAHGDGLPHSQMDETTRQARAQIGINLAGNPAAASLRRLSLPHLYLGDGGVMPLIDSPYLTELRELDLQGNALTDLTIRRMADSTQPCRLEKLALHHQYNRPCRVYDLRDGQAHPVGVPAQAEPASPPTGPGAIRLSPFVRNSYLRERLTSFTAKAMEQLASSPRLSHLKQLSTNLSVMRDGHSQLPQSMAGIIANSPLRQQLTHLDFYQERPPIGEHDRNDAVVSALGDDLQHTQGQLRHLGLHDIEMGDEALRSVLGKPAMADLHSFTLRNLNWDNGGPLRWENNPPPPMPQALFDAALAPKLRRLALKNFLVDATALNAIADSSRLEHLTHLTLVEHWLDASRKDFYSTGAESQLTRAGEAMNRIANAEKSRNLRVLRLRDDSIPFEPPSSPDIHGDDTHAGYPVIVPPRISHLLLTGRRFPKLEELDIWPVGHRDRPAIDRQLYDRLAEGRSA